MMKIFHNVSSVMLDPLHPRGEGIKTGCRFKLLVRE